MAITLDQWEKQLERLVKSGGLRKVIKQTMIAGAVKAQGAAVRHFTAAGLHRRTGDLANSIRSKAKHGATGSEITTIVNKKYASTHEYGATITPKKGKYLTIPVGPAKTAGGDVRMSARQTPGLFFAIGKQSGKPFLGRANDDGSVTAFFLLRERVTIKARPFVRPAMEDVRKWLPSEIHRRLGKELAHG